MPVLITFKEYLARLNSLEKIKPDEERRKVPKLGELAAVSGIDRVPFTRLVNGQVKRVNTEVIDNVITEMRRRGFPMELSDFMMYLPPEEVK